MTLICTTDRLYLRELTIADAQHFYQMNNDPDVLKYTGDLPFDSIEAAQEFLTNYLTQYEVYGMGRWAVCLKGTDEVIGWCGLKYHPDEQLVDVGYRFYQKYWNKGYATEATKGAITYGFNSLKLPKIVAHVHEDNEASHKVALKAGMQFIKHFIYDNKPARFYCITPSDL